MSKKSIIRIICAFVIAVAVFFITRMLCFLVIDMTLGNTAYAVNAPLMLPLQLIAAFASIRLFTIPEDVSIDFEEEIYADEALDEVTKAERTVIDLDESTYPELFETRNTTKNIPSAKPDIKSIISKQKSELAEEKIEEAEVDDLLSSFNSDIDDSEQISSIYDDIPSELPDDYKTYEEVYDNGMDTDDDEAEDADEYDIPRIPPLVSRMALFLICSVLAVLLPINAATVYSPDKIIKRSLFSQKEYTITEADHYTVGVKLSGDISMKLHFSDGSEHQLIMPSFVTKSSRFSSSFSSQYGYAAFCDRLLQRNGINKIYDDLTSLSPSPALYETDIAYIEEIAGISLSEINK